MSQAYRVLLSSHRDYGEAAQRPASAARTNHRQQQVLHESKTDSRVRRIPMLGVAAAHHAAGSVSARSMRRSGMSHMIATKTYSAQASQELTKESGIATA